jgi:ATP-binding cassette subfamily F protein uup
MRQGIRARGTRSKKRVDNFHELMGKVKDLQSMERKSLKIELSHTGRQTKALVELKKVCQKFSQRTLFKDVDLKIHKKDKIGLLGSNGTGKTTLIEILCQKINPTSGEVKLADDLVIKHYSQHRTELDEEQTPFEFLGQGQDQVILPDGRAQHVMSYFEKFLFNRDDIHRPIRYFSGGERNRLQLAYHMLGPADLWIFDEPTNDLDLETLEVLEKTLTDFKQALILISHDRAFLNNVTNKILLIHEQQVETFQSGYSQAENFLEALKMETLLKKGQEETPDVIEEAVEQDQQEALKHDPNLDHKIDEHESMVEKIQGQLKQMSQDGLKTSDAVKRYGELNTLVEKLEQKLLALYEQQEQN